MWQVISPLIGLFQKAQDVHLPIQDRAQGPSLVSLCSNCLLGGSSWDSRQTGGWALLSPHIPALREKPGTTHMVRPLRNPLLVCTEVGETPIQRLLISLNLITGATRPGEDVDKNQCPSLLRLWLQVTDIWGLLSNSSSSYYSGRGRGPFTSLLDFRRHLTNLIRVPVGSESPLWVFKLQRLKN